MRPLRTAFVAHYYCCSLNRLFVGCYQGSLYHMAICYNKVSLSDCKILSHLTPLLLYKLYSSLRHGY